MFLWLSVASPVIALLSKMTGAQSCRVALTLLPLASLVTVMGFTVDIYKHTKDPALKKWLVPLLFFLAVVIAITSWLIVVCLETRNGVLQSLRRKIGTKAPNDSPMPQGVLAPAYA